MANIYKEFLWGLTAAKKKEKKGELSVGLYNFFKTNISNQNKIKQS